jgi:Tol biopolymer transport system component
MSLAPGTRLGPYEILAPIGAGGMGEVYRARDTTLDREVAIKVLPAALAQDPERLARFKREAKVLASLNHPNIAQIYSVEDRALVMELVAGESPNGPLPLDTALNHARQIAVALEAAHEKGIIHRDLKPANILITHEGVVKVLDFGLAAVGPVSSDGSDPATSPTVTMPTQAGVIMGTAAYMSPEQAAGKSVDRRADIWSFGVVVWELLTGHRLFQGETVSHTLADVLRGPIDFDKLPRDTPPEIRTLLRRCLDRNVKNRLRDIGEARIAIDAALVGGARPPTAAPDRDEARWQLSLAWGVAAAAVVLAAGLAFVHFREKPPTLAAPVRFQIPAPENTKLTNNLKLSPDGRKLAFLAASSTTSAGSVGTRLRLWVHFLESGESRDLAPAGGWLFWSPDSRFIGYTWGNKLKKIEATGGPPQTVADLDSADGWGGGAWNQDDVIVFGDTGPLFRVPASGGVPVPITALDPARHETSHLFPAFLPDGRHFLYRRYSVDKAKVEVTICIGTVDAKPEQQRSMPMEASGSWLAYAPSADPITGYLLFVREGALMAQPFDNRRLELKGNAVPVAGLGEGDLSNFSASANDVLVFLRDDPATNRQLTWYDRESKALGNIGEPGGYGDVVLSPDGTRLAVSKFSSKTSSNIWLMDLPGGRSTRFTFGSAMDVGPVWSPDGSSIIFESNRDGRGNLYQKPVSSLKEEEILLRSSEDNNPESWSRDGRFLLYLARKPNKNETDIWVLPLEGDKKPFPFLITDFSEDDAHFSPDGRWVAYTSDESGQREVYVRSFSMNPARTAVEAGGKWHISAGSGAWPHWRNDGRELYYRSLPDGRLMAVDIATTPTFRAGTPRPLGTPLSFTTEWPDEGTLWDSTADGKRFLIAAPMMDKPEPYTVVLNWQAGLKR